ncbi:Hypothetical predicted protein [Mytilus galloprovincialis]|uniref:Uncharacterized protein n=1 Tax=Mytilus galloprovincialis TaxID=29158 RepID=A0A8B6ET51_MYTGA|nr:Hypothetical predicted protein [Mytilus galloprovincialis]
MRTVKDLSQKGLYICCLLVTTGALCPLKGNQMPWKSPCRNNGNEDELDKPDEQVDNGWIIQLIIVLQETNDYFIELKRLYISVEILHDYQKLATVLVFVEQIVWENDTVGDRDDRDILCNIYRKIRDALCEIRNHSQKTLIDKVTPTRNAMHLEYRIVDNRTTRFQRNYIIFKDASRYLRAISSKYIRLYFQS